MCVIFFAIYFLYAVCLQYFAVFDESAIYSDVMGAVVALSVFSGTQYQVDSMLAIFFLQCWPMMVCQILSICASIGTVYRLFNETIVHPVVELRNGGNPEQESRQRSFKILVTNVGSLIQTGAMLLVITMTVKISTTLTLPMSYLYVYFGIFVMLPTLLSCYNPLIYMVLTPRMRHFVKSYILLKRHRTVRCLHVGRSPGIPMSAFHVRSETQQTPDLA